MKTRLYLDKRGKRKDEPMPVKVAINVFGSSVYIATGQSLLQTQWNARSCEAVNHSNSSRINLELARFKLSIDTALESLRLEGKLHALSPSQIRRLVLERVSGREEQKQRFMYRFDRYAQNSAKKRTRTTYEATARKIRAFDSTADSLTFDDITKRWLTDFDKWMAETMPAVNGRIIHLRNIRTVFNEAIDDGITGSYPFRKFKLRAEPTRDRSLTRAQLRELTLSVCSEYQKEYQDMFRLVFLLGGINLHDLIEVKQLINGRIEIKRAKTGQPLSIPVIPEAQRIIEKYRGDSHLLNIAERYAHYEDYQARMNRHLKRIGMTYNPHTKKWEGQPVCKDVSMYWARYSWATIAAELDIPERTIGATLGHSTKSSVTSIYMRTDMRRKIDDAIKKVVSFVYGENYLL